MKNILLGVLLLFLMPNPQADEMPEDIQAYCEYVGNEYNICPELLEAIAYYESRFTPTAKNGSHYGMMQINVKVHKERLVAHEWTKEDMYIPYRNLVIAAEYLSELYEEYEENAIVLAMYSGNSKAVKKYEKHGTICSYAKKVLEKSYEYETLHGKHEGGKDNVRNYSTK